MPHVLILGGTTEARAIAGGLVAAGVRVTTSLAGPTDQPPAGALRHGGFGGPAGLARWIAEHDVGTVIDATHPFAERISAAAEHAGVPVLRVERPAWHAQPGDRWERVGDLAAAAAAIRGRYARVFLTTGRRGLGAFAGVDDAWFLVRCLRAPDPPLPPRHELLLDRGPYDRAGELALLDRHRIDVVVTKDSGGAATEPKLAAARERGLPVILVRRPPPPGVPAVSSPAEALEWVHRRHARAQHIRGVTRRRS